MDKRAIQLKELTDYWNRIEERVKQVENLRGEVVIPAINELRYAGRRFLDAWAISHTSDGELSSDDQEKFDEMIAASRQYLMNADHDLGDAVCGYIGKTVRKLLTTYGIGNVRHIVPEIDEIYNKVKEAEQKRAHARKDRSRRTALYEELSRDYVPWFWDKLAQLEDAEVRSLTFVAAQEQKLEKLNEKLQAAEKYNTLSSRINYSLGGLALVLSVIQVWTLFDEGAKENIKALLFAPSAPVASPLKQ